MKILLLQDGEWRKKGPHQQHHLMELLSLRGHEIMVIGFDQLWQDEKEGLISKRVEADDVCRFYKGAKVKFIKTSFIRIPVLDYISFLFSSRSEIKKQVRNFNPDVIIGFSAVISNYWGVLYANKAKIPYMYYWFDIVHVLNIPKPFGFIAEIIEKKIIKKSDSIVVINEVLKDYIVNFGADPKITEVIPGGVDFERFNPSKIDSNYYREKFGFSDDDTVMFFMGWLYHFSGLKEVVKELAHLRDKHPHIKLLIVGRGDAYSDLKELIKTHKLEEAVIMTGEMPYDEIPKLIAAADICLLPAYNNEIMRDIVPIKIYEYLAMHKPVITTKLPGVMKEFGHNNGLIYVDNSEKVLEIVTNLTKKDIQDNKQKAADFIKDYDWNNIMMEFENLLESLLE